MGFERTDFNNSAGTGINSVTNHYGPRTTDQRYGGTPSTKGYEKELVWVIDLATAVTQTAAGIADSTTILSGSTSNLEQVIPAYAKILSCRAENLTAVVTTGGSAATSGSIQVGLVKASDGSTAIDADGLIDATDGALTITSNDIAEVRGAYHQGGSAALVPDYGTAATPGETVSIGADAANLTAIIVSDDSAGQATMTGKIRIVVNYTAEGPGGA